MLNLLFRDIFNVNITLLGVIHKAARSRVAYSI